MKDKSEDGTATIWLTTAEMGFSLTEEQDNVVCTKDVKEGKITDPFEVILIGTLVLPNFRN